MQECPQRALLQLPIDWTQSQEALDVPGEARQEALRLIRTWNHTHGVFVEKIVEEE